MRWQFDKRVLCDFCGSLHVCIRSVSFTLKYFTNRICVSVKRKLNSSISIGICCSGNATHVLLGDLNYATETDDAQPRLFRIVERKKHPLFKLPSKYNDIALVKINGPVEFNNYIRPACLPQTSDIETMKVIATGWGKLNHHSPTSDHMQKVVLELFTQRECNQSYVYEISRQLKHGIVEETQMCAGSHFERKDTCQVSELKY